MNEDNSGIYFQITCPKAIKSLNEMQDKYEKYYRESSREVLEEIKKSFHKNLKG